MLNFVCWQFRRGGNQQAPQVPAPRTPTLLPPKRFGEEGGANEKGDLAAIDIEGIVTDGLKRPRSVLVIR